MKRAPSTDRSLLGRVFDAYQNLSQIARCIETSAQLRSLDRPSRILELSRQPTGLSDFLTSGELIRHATHVDDQPVLGTPARLPFESGEFDICFVTDAYEHIPKEMRQGLLTEMMRVTEGVVLLGAPHDDPIVDRWDKIAFDFIWGKFAEEFQPLAQHDRFGLEPIEEITARFLELGASEVAALPCNYVYRWIHQMLIYFDFHHRNPAAHLYESVNQIYNEFLSPYDYREPCYRYLLVVPTDSLVDIAAFSAAMVGPIETRESVTTTEGVLINEFRAADSRVSDALRRYIDEMEVTQRELVRLRAKIELLRPDAS